MNYLLFGGAPYAGKSEAITRLVDYLMQQKNFVRGNFKPLPNKDFFCILDGKDKNNHSIRIIVTSASDTFAIINDYKIYCKNNFPYDIVISPIRDEGDDMRNHFFKAMNITNSDICVEIPLAKITRRANWEIAYNWYKEKIDNMINNCLEHMPFNI
jgi:hypothetical protein